MSNDPVCENPCSYKFWMEEEVERGGETVPRGGLANAIDFGVVEYNTQTVCNIFDRFYKRWNIIDPYDEFAEDLQTVYDVNKERIDRYYKYTVGLIAESHNKETYTFGERTTANNRGARTDTMNIGNRHSKDKGYDYPVSGDVAGSSPSQATDSTSDASTDSTVYGAQNDTASASQYVNIVERTSDQTPIKTVEQIEALKTFMAMFIDCFKSCFTLFEGATW